MSAIGLLRQTVDEWMEDKAMRLSAALAYYSVFSLAPLLIIAISVAGVVFGEEAARGAIERQLTGSIGQESANAVEEMIEGAHQSDSSGIMAIVGVIVLLFSASGVFGQLKDAMNTIWEIELKPGRGIFGMIKDRFLSLTMVLGVGFLLLISLILSSWLSAVHDYLGAILPLPGTLWQVIGAVVSLAVVTLLFALIFKILPDAEVRWKDVWIGAFLTSGLFTVGKLLLSLYLGRQDAASTYGAAGAFVLILLWVYYSSCILLFGAEFTQVYAKTRGGGIVPSEDAVAVDEATRAAQGMPDRDALEKVARRDDAQQTTGRPR